MVCSSSLISAASDHSQPVHPPGAAICLCTRRPILREGRPTDAYGNGARLCCPCVPVGRRRMGGDSQSICAARGHILLGIFGIAILLPSLAHRLAQLVVSLCARLSQSSDALQSGVLSSAVLGVATGLLGLGKWIRRALGVAVLGAVAAIAFGLDTGFLTQLSLANTSSSNLVRLLDGNIGRLDTLMLVLACASVFQ